MTLSRLTAEAENELPERLLQLENEIKSLNEKVEVLIEKCQSVFQGDGLNNNDAASDFLEHERQNINNCGKCRKKQYEKVKTRKRRRSNCKKNNFLSIRNKNWRGMKKSDMKSTWVASMAVLFLAVLVASMSSRDGLGGLDGKKEEERAVGDTVGRWNDDVSRKDPASAAGARCLTRLRDSQTRNYFGLNGMTLNELDFANRKMEEKKAIYTQLPSSSKNPCWELQQNKPLTMKGGKINEDSGSAELFFATKSNGRFEKENFLSDLHPIIRNLALPHRSLQTNSKATTYYYPDFVNEFCGNDPDVIATILQIGMSLFESLEDCCDQWFSSQKEQCMQRSPSASPTVFSTSNVTNTPLASTAPNQIESLQSTVGNLSSALTSDSPSLSPSQVPTKSQSQAPVRLDTINSNSTHNIFSSSSFPSSEQTTPSSSCQNFDSKVCGCREALQTDYRGNTNVTRAGKRCMTWGDTTNWKPSNYTGEGLEGNFCRNPGGTELFTWCWIENEPGNWDYCDIPMCGEEVCINHDPDKCGCANNFQIDYSGTINRTRGGLACKSWPDEFVAAFPSADLQGHNYCRNPTAVYGDKRAWCAVYIGLGGPNNIDWDYCDVPMCEEDCPPPDTTICGCASVRFADYRGNISVTKNGEECLNWNETLDLENGYLAQDYMDSGLESNVCRNSDSREEGTWCFINAADTNKGFCEVAACDACSCRPSDCDVSSNMEQCSCPSVLQADHCCEETDDACRCEYLKMACLKSMEKDQVYFCDEAAIACHGKNEIIDKCRITQSICYEYQGIACNFAADYCCSTSHIDGPYAFQVQSYHTCKCEFSQYMMSSFGYEMQNLFYSCMTSRDGESLYFNDKKGLEIIYKYNGNWWFDNTGWLNDEIDHCSWFGVSCEDGRVIQVDLPRNNVTGPISNANIGISILCSLQKINLAENSLTGSIENNAFYASKELSHIDLSGNHLNGPVDVYLSPASQYVNLSHNDFSSYSSFKQFHPAHQMLTSLDLSYNRIKQDLSNTVHANMPKNLVDIRLNDNFLFGKFSNNLPHLDQLQMIALNGNNLSGSLPDLSLSFPELRVLRLHNQTQNQNKGLSGSLPVGFSSLQFLVEMNLADNSLSNNIPPEIGNLAQLEFLNLARNRLDGTIPENIRNLAQLKFLDLSSNRLIRTIPTFGTLFVLNLSKNSLTGKIPYELGSLSDATLAFGGNNNLSKPAPLSMCSLMGFDLADNIEFCPPERNALKDFFDSAKGGEWSESYLWLDNYGSHCDWKGVGCNEKGFVTELQLQTNGLSGKLSAIGNLTFLEYLDLSDNDIKGTLPPELGLLRGLIQLRLSFNSFTGSVPKELANLEYLKLIHLHGNRLHGQLPALTLDSVLETSSFISDCGTPSDFAVPLLCPFCTMCCNAEGQCHTTKEPKLLQIDMEGFDSYEDFSWVYVLSSCGYLSIVFLASFAYDRLFKGSSKNIHSHDHAIKEVDKKYALEAIGNGSVYCFFLSRSWIAWIFAVVVMGIQTWILSLFVKAAEIDFTDDSSVFVYSWRCPRNSLDCDNTADDDFTGWAIFAILMVSHLMKDFINGTKLLVLCAKRRHSVFAKIRFFFGGLCLVMITAYTAYASTIYNMAIARSNTDIVVNSVVILFITHIDEQFYMVFLAALPSWVRELRRQLVRTTKVDELTADIDVARASANESSQDGKVQVKITHYFRKTINAEVAV